jgi:hypothetical protein
MAGQTAQSAVFHLKSRPSTSVTPTKKKDVDARDKRGHDVERFAFQH